MTIVMRTINTNGIKMYYNIYDIKAEFVSKINSNQIIIPQKIYDVLKNFTVKIIIDNEYSFIHTLNDRKIYIPYQFNKDEVFIKIEVIECQ
jgi:hypothetical protein